MTRALKAFAWFWWDLVAGDTPELTIGVLVALGAVYLLPKGATTLAGVVLFGIVAATVGVSLLIEARRGAHRRSRPG